MKEQAIIKNMIALARRRGGKGKGKSGNLRSKMLRMIMPMLSRENGDKLAKAIDSRNVGLFRKVWDEIKSQLTHKLEVHASAESSIDDQTLDKLREAFEEAMNDQAVSLASNRDYSHILVGNSITAQLTRALMANGMVELPEGGVVRIESLDVVRGGDMGDNVRMKVKAGLYVDGKETVRGFFMTGELAPVCSEIVMKAMAAQSA